jgi:hypothetical protein
MEPADDHTNHAACIGKIQVLGLIAKGCTAAQAACMKQFRDTDYHKTINLTWAEFCPKYFGISRDTADQQIRCLEQLGAAWFRLNEVVRISPKTFRRIRSAIQGESLEIDGQMVPITPENSVRIRDTVLKMRAELSRPAPPEEPVGPYASPEVAQMRFQFARDFSNLVSMVQRYKSPKDVEALTGLVNSSVQKLGEIRELLGAQRP